MPDASLPLLQNLLDLGERMITALERGEMDTYFTLLDERGTLLDRILDYRHPSEIDPGWKAAAEALALQHEAIMEIAASNSRRMQDAITRIEQVKEAQRSYHRPVGRSNILNANLRV